MQRRKKKQMGWLETAFVIEFLVIAVFIVMYYGYLLFSHI